MATLSGIDITVRTDRNYDRILTVERQLNFATSRTLTRLATLGRDFAISNIKKQFKTRGEWFNPRRAYGIKIKASNIREAKGGLEATVWTAADWLVAHETPGGGPKKLSGKAGQSGRTPSTFALPSDYAHPVAGLSRVGPKRTSVGAISKIEKPGRLLRLKRRGAAFIVKTRGGAALVLQRLRKGAEPVLRWVLIKNARIEEERTINPAVETVVKYRADRIFEEEFMKALQDAKRIS